jgi:hypothetical protein
MRETTRLSWAEIRNGIGKKQMAVLEALHLDGPSTGRELEKASGIHGAWKRMSELKRLGLVKELPPRLCRVTKQAALVWAATVGEKSVDSTRCPCCGEFLRSK